MKTKHQSVPRVVFIQVSINTVKQIINTVLPAEQIQQVPYIQTSPVLNPMCS